MTAKPPEWFDSGLCAQTDPELFFPEKGRSNAQAKAICRQCPFKALCLEWALETDQRHGIWGGLSETERRELKPLAPVGRPRPPCGTSSAHRSHYRHGEQPCQPCRDADSLHRKLRRKAA